MSEQRNLVTPISIAIAVICAAWAIYATQHKPAPGAGMGDPQAGGMRGGPPPQVTLAPVSRARSDWARPSRESARSR